MRVRYGTNLYFKSLKFAVSALLLGHAALAQNGTASNQRFSGPCGNALRRVESITDQLALRQCNGLDNSFCESLRTELANAERSRDVCIDRQGLAAALPNRRGSSRVATRRSAAPQPVAVDGSSSPAPTSRRATMQTAAAQTPQSTRANELAAIREAELAQRAVDAVLQNPSGDTRPRTTSRNTNAPMTIEQRRILRESEQALRAARISPASREMSALIAAGRSQGPRVSTASEASARASASSSLANQSGPLASQPILRRTSTSVEPGNLVPTPAPASAPSVGQASARARQLASMLGGQPTSMRERDIAAPTANDEATGANAQPSRSLTEINQALRSGPADSAAFQRCVSKAREMACYFGLNTNFSCSASELGIVGNHGRSDYLGGLQGKWQALQSSLPDNPPAAGSNDPSARAVLAVWRDSQRMLTSGNSLRSLLHSIDQPSADPAVRARQANELSALMAALSDSTRRITENRNQSTSVAWFAPAADFALSSERARGYSRGGFNLQLSNEANRACRDSFASDDQIATGRARDRSAPRTPANEAPPSGGGAPASGAVAPSEDHHVAAGA